MMVCHQNSHNEKLSFNQKELQLYAKFTKNIDCPQNQGKSTACYYCQNVGKMPIIFIHQFIWMLPEDIYWEETTIVKII